MTAEFSEYVSDRLADVVALNPGSGRRERVPQARQG
jgi:hypothetical protein